MSGGRLTGFTHTLSRGVASKEHPPPQTPTAVRALRGGCGPRRAALPATPPQTCDPGRVVTGQAAALCHRLCVHWSVIVLT